jgi:hypothetical protein
VCVSWSLSRPQSRAAGVGHPQCPLNGFQYIRCLDLLGALQQIPTEKEESKHLHPAPTVWVAESAINLGTAFLRRLNGTDVDQLGFSLVPIAPNARHDFEAKGGLSVGPPYAYITRVGGNGRKGEQADRRNRANAGSPSREHRASQRARGEGARAAAKS